MQHRVWPLWKHFAVSLHISQSHSSVGEYCSANSVVVHTCITQTSNVGSYSLELSGCSISPYLPRQVYGLDQIDGFGFL